VIAEEEAQARILARVAAGPNRTVSLAEARECFVAGDIFARLPLPPFDNSAMDGYAIVSSDGKKGKRLKIVGEQPAGIDRGLEVHAGEAIRIFTGAPLPRGADAVVMQEDVTRAETEIVLQTDALPNEFVRRRGSDLSEGQKILAAGERLRPEQLALLAAQGFGEVEVGAKIRAAVVSTGDELARAGQRLRPGQLFESNATLLRGLLEELGAGIESVQHAGDEREDLRRILEAGKKCDALVISGGVSVGERDLVRPVLQELGAEIDLWRVAIKPGKPFLFGRIGSCAVFGLPGNPVSAFVTFLILVRPALLKMMGASSSTATLPSVLAKLAAAADNRGERVHYLRGQLRDGIFQPIGRQESHALYSLSRCNALLRVLPGQKFSAGAEVRILSWA
jgi:molybdopterin molybdotransferase